MIIRETKARLFYERGLLHSKTGQHALAYNDLKLGNTLHPNNADIKRELEKLEKQNLVTRSTTDIPPKNPDVKKEEQAKKEETKKVDPPIVPETKQNDVIASSENKKKDTPSGKEEIKKNDAAIKREQAVAKKEAAKIESTNTSVKTGAVTTPSGVTISPLAEFYKDEKRFALVIGNSNYPKSIGVLKNPVNDATDFAKELEQSNFEVQLLTNATYGQMRAAMLKFKEKVDANDRDKTVALFYFAGHGLQHEDENYLVPIDASIEFEDDIARYCFAVQRMVLSNMERSNSRMNIVILDACRNNPFPALTRSAGELGLAEMKRARGSFMAFATAPGSVASDGHGRNGLYTQELLKSVRKPGLTIEQVFKDVRANVLRMSGNKQNTWDSSNIIGEFYFRF